MIMSPEQVKTTYRNMVTKYLMYFQISQVVPGKGLMFPNMFLSSYCGDSPLMLKGGEGEILISTFDSIRGLYGMFL